MTNAEFAILSLLAEQSSHGYDLEKTIEARGMREWTEIGFSSIYYLLKKLQIAGLISTTGQEGTGSDKARKVYKITPVGKKACTKTAKEMLAHPHPIYPSILLGLANIPLLVPSDVVEALNTRDSELDQRLTHIERQQRIQAPTPPFVNAIFTYSIAMVKTEKRWLNQTLKEMETKNAKD